VAKNAEKNGVPKFRTKVSDLRREIEGLRAQVDGLEAGRREFLRQESEARAVRERQQKRIEALEGVEEERRDLQGEVQTLRNSLARHATRAEIFEGLFEKEKNSNQGLAREVGKLSAGSDPADPRLVQQIADVVGDKIDDATLDILDAIEDARPL
jgi:predicted nuclease with TOPRIM domain